MIFLQSLFRTFAHRYLLLLPDRLVVFPVRLLAALLEALNGFGPTIDDEGLADAQPAVPGRRSEPFPFL
jgi:hypothetical protein